MPLRESLATQFASFRPSAPGLPLHQALLPDFGGEHLLISVDTLNVGVHFGAEDDAVAVGHKSLAVNLSDLAAMGATARWATLTLRLPQSVDDVWVQRFRDGFDALAQRYAVTLCALRVGEGPLAITVEVLGTAPPGASLRRAGAQPGDRILVSGTLGDAAFGLQQRLAGVAAENVAQAWLQQRLDRPTPRLELGLLLRGQASSAIDLSDGLISDLGHILHASGVGASLQSDRLPLSDALRASASSELACACALSGGDDYELCFTLPPQRVQAFCTNVRNEGMQVTEIGVIDDESGLRVFDAQGARVASVAKGFDHFAR